MRRAIWSGIVTDGDLRRHMGADLAAASASARSMTKGPLTIRANAAGGRSGAGDERTLDHQPVRGRWNGKPAGIVRLHDCLKAGVA